MSKWFRFNADAIRHPKVIGLADKPYRLWTELLCIAAENGGKLYDEKYLSKVLNRRLDHLLAALYELVKAGLIDVIEGGYVPHDWDHYQMKSDISTERVREWRRKRNVSETEHDNEHDNSKIEAHIDSSPILKDSTKLKQLTKSKDLVRSAFEKFWTSWPHKVGKPPAERAFAKAFGKHGLDAILNGLDRYMNDKPPDRPWLNPATFLNQERFFDEPAPANGGELGPKYDWSKELELARLCEEEERKHGKPH